MCGHGGSTSILIMLNVGIFTRLTKATKLSIHLKGAQRCQTEEGRSKRNWAFQLEQLCGSGGCAPRLNNEMKFSPTKIIR